MSYDVKMKNGASYRWYVGQKCPISRDACADIELIQADGDELGVIVQQYKCARDVSNTMYNIPMPMNIRVVVWYGDIAAGIVANLDNKPYEHEISDVNTSSGIPLG